MEDDSKLSLLFLHVHKEAEEGGDQVIFAALVQCIVHLALLFKPGLLSNLSGVNFLSIFIGGLLFIVILSRHTAIFADTELLAGTLG